MRVLLASLLLATPAIAQTPGITVQVGPDRPRSWQEADVPQPRFEPSGIALPRDLAGLSLTRTVDRTGRGLDGLANYAGPGVDATLFVFQPIATEAGPANPSA